MGIALSEKYNDVPAFPIMMGIGLMDVAEGVFLNMGLAEVAANCLAGPYLFFDLIFTDWDHSLLAAIFWSVLWGLVFFRQKKVALLAGLSVFSHYLVDLPFHTEMALYPYSAVHMGLGLWEKMEMGSWLLEGIFVVVLIAYAWKEAAKRKVQLWLTTALAVILFVGVSPWFAITKQFCSLPIEQGQPLLGLTFIVSFILPALMFTWIAKRQRR